MPSPSSVRFDLGKNRGSILNHTLTTVDDYSHSDQSSRSQYSRMKVSEIVNPDGSLTIRNLHIDDHGIWSKHEHEVDNQEFAMPHRASPLTSRESSFDKVDYTKSKTDGMKRVESSEAIAHQLRRQRLAQQSPFVVDVSSNSTPVSHTSNRSQDEGQKLINSLYASSDSRGSRMMNTRMYLPTDPPSPSRPSRSRSKSASRRHKHVAFSEPLSHSQFQQGHDGFYPTSGESTNYATSFDPFYHEEKSDLIMDIYSDLDRGQSFSSGHSDAESSVFDNVAQISNIDRILGQLQDTRALLNNHSFADDKERRIPHLYSVTVNKASEQDKLGIYVHVETASYGKRLVVSKVAPDGKFANTKIKEGDVVVSINGEDMTEDPTLEKALNVVTSAKESVTIVVYEDFGSNDSQSAAQTSISSISKDISSVAHGRDNSQFIDKPPPLFRTSDKVDYFAQEFNNGRAESRAMATKGRMTGDGSMLISKDSEILEPISIKMNESWKLSGVIVVNIEKTVDTLKEPGLHMGVKETSTGHAVYISGISPSSVFAKTPLRVGDIVISINNISLYNNVDVVDAYKALGKLGKRITLVAKKGEQSLNKFLVDGRRPQVSPRDVNIHKREDSVTTSMTSQTSGTMGSSHGGESSRGLRNESTESPGSNSHSSEHESVTNTSSFERDEESHGSSRLGYKTGRVKITKNTLGESIGIDLVEVATQWGRLLAISKIIPRSKASLTELKVGDVILTINGISFRNNPDVESAISLVREAQREVCIEFQKLSSFSPSVQGEMQKSKSGTVEVSETEDGILKEFEDNQKSLTNNSTQNQRGQHESASLAKSCMLPDEGKRTKKRQKVLVTVTKDKKSQKIGIRFEVLNNKLVVAEVNPRGLLRNAPLVYGDTVLTINGVNFRHDPVAKEATELVRSAPKRVTLEIMKIEYPSGDSGVGTKSCIQSPFCKRGRKIDDAYPSTKL